MGPITSTCYFRCPKALWVRPKHRETPDSESRQWATGRKDRPDWNASSLGLAGWSIDVIQRYDSIHHVLISGDGSWRFADRLALPAGQTAIPSYDGAVAYVFDRAGRHVRTVDGH